MFAAIGLVVLLGMVFGGFVITGGKLEPVLEAIPHEMLIIGGAAVGAVLAGNSMKELKALGGGMGKVFKGPTYKKKDYLDTIFLVSSLMKLLLTETGHEMALAAQELIGDEALIEPAPAGTSGRGPEKWLNQIMGSLGNSIAGGTTNIQRNIIAERGLGLPRDLAMVVGK